MNVWSWLKKMRRRRLTLPRICWNILEMVGHRFSFDPNTPIRVWNNSGFIHRFSLRSGFRYMLMDVCCYKSHPRFWYRSSHQSPLSCDVTDGLYMLGVARPGVRREVKGVWLWDNGGCLWSRSSRFNEWIRLVSAQFSVGPVKWWTRICLSRLRQRRQRNRAGANVNKRKWSWRKWWPIRKLDDRTPGESFWERYFGPNNFRNTTTYYIIDRLLRDFLSKRWALFRPVFLKWL